MEILLVCSFVLLRGLRGLRLCPLCWLSIHRAVVQLDHAARALLGGIYNAGIKWTRIDVQTHGALGKFQGIQHAMHRVARINCAWMSRVHFDDICRRELTAAMVQVLRE